MERRREVHEGRVVRDIGEGDDNCMIQNEAAAIS